MQNIFQWLNANNGVLNAFALIASSVACISAIISAKAAHDQVKEMKEQYESENRPYIEVEFIFLKGVFCALRFINQGRHVAVNVKIAFDEKFIKSLPEPEFVKVLKDIKGKSCVIGVGQHYDLFFGTRKYINSKKEEPAKGFVTYESSCGDKYNSSFDIPMENYATIYTVDSVEKDLLNQMKKQTDEFKNMRCVLKHLTETINNQNSDQND